MFNLIKIEKALATPNLMTCPAPWAGHTPFAMWLVSVIRPAVIVELGAYSGISYLSFCQSVRAEGLATRCYAIDTWRGDPHAGFYGEHVYQNLKSLHDQHYSSFSSLIRKEFDDAVHDFPDGSIDILHIDGLHTYEAVKHDYLTWRCKLSRNSVVIFHDINVYIDGFGVHKFWSEISREFPSLTFLHSNGLGVLFFGSGAVDLFQRDVGKISDLDDSSVFKSFFSALGAAQERRAEISGLRHELGEVGGAFASLKNEHERLMALFDANQKRLGQSEEERSALSGRLSDAENRLSALVGELHVAGQRADLLQSDAVLLLNRLGIRGCDGVIPKTGSNLSRDFSELSHQKYSGEFAEFFSAIENEWRILKRRIDAGEKHLASAVAALSSHERKYFYTEESASANFLRSSLHKANYFFARGRNALRYLLRGDFTGLYRRLMAIKSEKSAERLSFSGESKVVIMTPPHTLYLANAIKNALSVAGVSCELCFDTSPADFNADMYIVLCAQIFDRLPPGERRIIFQLEQSVSDRWFDDKYISLMESSLAVFDYSVPNLKYLSSRGLNYPLVYHVPIGGDTSLLRDVGAERSGDSAKTIDVLFYGDASSPRRKRYLDELSKKFKVLVVSNEFGAGVRQKISSAKVVVNIHYYDDALLESTRIFECLSLGAHVVSETATDVEDYPELGSVVNFVPIDDVSAMVSCVERVLAGTDSTASSATFNYLKETENRFQFMLLRSLLSLGIIDYQKFFDVTSINVSAQTALSLPETLERRAAWIENPLPGSQVFDGVRFRPGWMGCAMSYKYLCGKALAQGLDRILICEDDAEWPEDNGSTLLAVNEYLDRFDGEWDIFVGIIANLKDDVRVSRVEVVNGLTFVTLNRMTSTVFNIYSRRAMEIVSNWDESCANDQTNTIDRYLERCENLRVVTLLEPLFGHREDQSSTLWGFGNQQYNDMIQATRTLLQRKVNEFLANAG